MVAGVGKHTVHALIVVCLIAVLSGTGCARHRHHVPPPLPDSRGSVAECVPAIWPVAHPALRISSEFGESRSGGRRHKGIDMAVPQGTPVMATASGTAIFSGRQGAYGNIIVINHGGGYETAYAHLHKRLTNAGNRIRRGQTIGLVGATGNATGPHLHYEVRRNGVAVNPRPWLP